MVTDTVTKPTFEELFSNTLVKEVIDEYVNRQVEAIKTEKDTEIAELQTQLDTMAATILMPGGAK